MTVAINIVSQETIFKYAYMLRIIFWGKVS